MLSYFRKKAWVRALGLWTPKSELSEFDKDQYERFNYFKYSKNDLIAMTTNNLESDLFQIKKSAVIVKDSRFKIRRKVHKMLSYSALQRMRNLKKFSNDQQKTLISEAEELYRYMK